MKATAPAFTNCLRQIFLFAAFCLLLPLMMAGNAGAATIIWNGPTGADTNWSTGNNWTNATAGSSGNGARSSDDVKFFDYRRGSCAREYQ